MASYLNVFFCSKYISITNIIVVNMKSNDHYQDTKTSCKTSSKKDKMTNERLTSAYLKEFESLNKTTENIFELGKHNVLIILEDGIHIHTAFPAAGGIFFIFPAGNQKAARTDEKKENRKHNQSFLQIFLSDSFIGISSAHRFFTAFICIFFIKAMRFFKSLAWLNILCSVIPEITRCLYMASR